MPVLARRRRLAGSDISAIHKQEADIHKYRTEKMTLVFEFLDLNNDGILSLADTMAFPIQLLKRGKVEQGARLANLYKDYYGRVCHAAGYPVSPDSIVKKDWVRGAVGVTYTDWHRDEFMPGLVDVYFSAIDVNGDGSIEFSEWEQFYKARGIEDQAFCRRTFEKMDADGNGTISPEEFKHAFFQIGRGDNPREDYSFLYARRT